MNRSSPLKSLNLSGINTLVIAAVLFIGVSSCQDGQGTREIPKDKSSQADSLKELFKAPPETILISFKGAEINKAELRDAFLSFYSKPTADDTRQKAASRVFEAVLFRNYLYLDAIDKKMEPDPDIWDSWEARIPLWTGKFYSVNLAEKVTIDDAVANAIIPSAGYVMNVRQIVVEDLGKAQAIKEQAEGGDDFVELAKAHSIGPASTKGGLLTEPIITGLPSHYDQSVTDRLKHLEEGEISTVINTGLGYTIFLIEKKRKLYQDEIDNMVKDKKMKLKLRATSIMRDKILEKYPLELVSGAIEEALTTNDEDMVVGNVGKYAITWGWMKKVVTHLWANGRQAVANTSPGEWKKRVSEIAPDLALREEAVSEGFLENNPTYLENIERAKKDTLVKTAFSDLRRRTEPSLEEVFAYYLKSGVGGADVEGIYSLEGVTGLDSETAAQAVYTALSAGGHRISVKEVVGSHQGSNSLSGTFNESELNKDVVLSLERTPEGSVTRPVFHGGKWGVYRIMAKRRGEMPPFDSEFGKIKKSAWDIRVRDERGNILTRGLGSNPPVYKVERYLVTGLIEEWLDARKVLKGISPSGGTYH